MKVLLVSFMYGSTLIGGAETFMVGLTRSLKRHGHTVEVATTTSSRLQASSAFGIHWNERFPEGSAIEDGIPIRRFSVKNHDRLQRAASQILLRRVLKDLEGRTYLNEDPETWIQFLIEKAKGRPAVYQALYQFCRGPISPGLLRFLSTHTGDYDAILANMVPFNTMAYAVKAAKKSGRPIGIIPLFHHLDWYHHWKHFYDTFRAANHLFVLNDYSIDLFHRMGCHAIRLGVGFDPAEFPREPEKAALFRTRFHLPERGAMILFVGRKVQSKRYELAMETISELRKEGYHLFLVIVGPNEDQKDITGDGIFYLNRLSRIDLLLAYQSCDVLLEPTEFESFGIIFCEAWMYEKPVIGNRRCPAVASLIHHEKDGFLCASIEEFKNATLMLVKDTKLSRTMGRYGREKVLSEYTWDKIVKKIETTFTEEEECHSL